MATIWTTQKVGMIGGICASMLVAGSSAYAQTSYVLDGAPMLREVITRAIAASGANLTYRSVSSDQAEADLANLGFLHPPGHAMGIQSGIAPMSRNLASFIVSANPSWAPSDVNVLALAAGVVTVANTNGRCQNVTVALQNPTDPSLAQVTTDFSIILSGYPSGGPGSRSKGTTQECADPQRLQALSRLTACQGVNRIDHIYRLDDNSGVEEIFREHLQFDYWCNGRARGNLEMPGSNLLNADLDPIRRPCTTVAADATKAPSRCTFYPLDYPPSGGTCHDGEELAANNPRNPYGVPIPCSQGLIVALSEADPAAKDANLSIGKRIAADLNGFTMGLTGLAAVTQIPNQANVGTTVNTVTFEEPNIRFGQYMLMRRLFLQRRPDALAIGWVSSGRNIEEMRLFTWANNRCNMKAIVEEAGFVAPLGNCADACTDPANMTCLTPEPNDWMPVQNIGGETTFCDLDYPCVANGQTASTLAPPTCGGSGSACPAIPALPAGFACNLSSKCMSNSGCGSDASGVNYICK